MRRVLLARTVPPGTYGMALTGISAAGIAAKYLLYAVITLHDLGMSPGIYRMALTGVSAARNGC
jgi:hypothetical protein